MTLRELTQPLRASLAVLRRRVRSLVLLLGVSRTTAFLVGALLVFFAADYTLRLPLWVRAVFLVALIAGAVVVVVRRLLGPLAGRLDDQLLAGRVEAAHPEFRDRLRSALAFADAADDPDNEDSPDLMRVVADETVEMARAIPFHDVARSRVPARWALGAAALLLATSGAAISQAGLVKTFVLRSLLLHDIAWPRRTTLEVVGMTPESPRRVTRGRETTVQVRAEGWIPDRVEFRFWERDTGRRVVERVELTPTPEDPALFAITLPVYATYEFTVTGGDDDRALVHTIEALTPPAILTIAMECTYPVYLSKPSETLHGGDQRLPEGTKVRLDVTTNMPVARAFLSLGTGDPPVALERRGPDRFATDLAADRDLRYSIRLVGANGEENDPGVDTFVLRVAKDQAPSIRIVTPGVQTDRLPTGVLLVGFDVRDDHRVSGVRLRYRVNDDLERIVELGESGGTAVRLLKAPVPRTDQVLGVAAFDLASLHRDDGARVARGDRITYVIEANDLARQKARPRADYQVELVSEDELAQVLQGRQQDLRESVRHAGNTAAEASDKFVEATAERRDNGAEYRKAVDFALGRQARVIDDLNSIADRIKNVLNFYVFNRIDDRSGADQILAYYERHLLDPETRGGSAFTGALYRGLFAALGAREFRAGTAYRKLIEMADLIDRLAVDHAPGAYRALTRLNADRDADADEIIRQVAAEQKAVADGLERLDALMREWESYDGVVRFFKGLRETEANLVEDLGNLPK